MLQKGDAVIIKWKSQPGVILSTKHAPRYAVQVEEQQAGGPRHTVIEEWPESELERVPQPVTRREAGGR